MRLYWNATFVFMSTGGWELPDGSPCTFILGSIPKRLLQSKLSGGVAARFLWIFNFALFLEAKGPLASGHWVCKTAPEIENERCTNIQKVTRTSALSSWSSISLSSDRCFNYSQILSENDFPTKTDDLHHIMSLGGIFRVNVMFAVALRGTFAAHKQSKFASRQRWTDKSTERGRDWQSYKGGGEERKYSPKGPKSNTIRNRRPTAKPEKELDLDANKHAGGKEDRETVARWRFDLDTGFGFDLDTKCGVWSWTWLDWIRFGCNIAYLTHANHKRTKCFSLYFGRIPISGDTHKGSRICYFT